MHDHMQYDPNKVKVMSRWKLEILPFLEAISSAIYNGSLQLAADS